MKNFAKNTFKDVIFSCFYSSEMDSWWPEYSDESDMNSKKCNIFSMNFMEELINFGSWFLVPDFGWTSGK